MCEKETKEKLRQRVKNFEIGTEEWCGAMNELFKKGPLSPSTDIDDLDVTSDSLNMTQVEDYTTDDKHKVDAIYEVCRHYDIPFENIVSKLSEDSVLQNNWGEIKEDIIRELVHEHRKGKGDIANIFDVSESTVRRWYRKYSIESPSELEKWDDLSWDERGERVKNADGDRCVVCGRTREEQVEEFGTGLSTHHIVPKRLFDNRDVADAPENLVTVCSECHHTFEQYSPRKLFLELLSDGEQ